METSKNCYQSCCNLSFLPFSTTTRTMNMIPREAPERLHVSRMLVGYYPNRKTASDLTRKCVCNLFCSGVGLARKYLNRGSIWYRFQPRRPLVLSFPFLGSDIQVNTKHSSEPCRDCGHLGFELGATSYVLGLLQGSFRDNHRAI